MLADDEKYAPMVVSRAADIRFNETKTALDAESTRLYRELIPILEQNVTRIETDKKLRVSRWSSDFIPNLLFHSTAKQPVRRRQGDGSYDHQRNQIVCDFKSGHFLQEEAF